MDTINEITPDSPKRKPRKQMDMLHGPMLKNILIFALPLALCGILQQLFTSADMAVVYWFEDSVAQSAVNSNGALVNLIINLFSGLSVGVTVLIAEYVGKKKTDDLHSVVLTSLIIAVFSGFVLLGVGMGVSAPLLKLMDTPTDTLPLATEYLRVYFIGMPFLMIYNFGAAVLRGVGDTKKALFILLITGVLNIGLNVLFVAACNMSVAGVALATVICNIASAALVMVFIMKDGLFKIRPTSCVRKEYVKRIFVIGFPAGLQGVVFSIANVLIQSAVNAFGSSAVAGNGDAVNFEYYVYFFVNGFASSTVTFFGQNYAAGKYDRCKQVFKINMLAGLIISTVLCAVFTLGADAFIRIYTNDGVAVKFGVMRMWCVLSGSMLPCLYEIAGGALRGMGHSMLPAVFTVIGSCILRIVWIYTVYAAYTYYWLLMIIYPISWVVTGVALMISYYVICYKAGFYKKPHAVAIADGVAIAGGIANTDGIENAEAAACVKGDDEATDGTAEV
ncbi:MAG: MATE family efflux transporter [Clostridiales bacterium]|nr:MATE family efflux transporter [Clostridiales bacterium]